MSHVPVQLDPRLGTVADAQPYPLLFVTISGAHLYGFPSPDSDFDLRGVHILPLREVVGLDAGRETIEFTGIRDGLEIDLVSHDIKQFFGLLLKKNGYVLEQIFSPLVVRTTPAHEELITLARGCITRYHAYHYLGFAQTQWNLFQKESPRRVKPLLYVYRVLLTGIHLMRTGDVQANLVVLNQAFKLPQVDDLVARKLGGAEMQALPDVDFPFHEAEYNRLRASLESAMEQSTLPKMPTMRRAVDDLLIRLRLGDLAAGG